MHVVSTSRFNLVKKKNIDKKSVQHLFNGVTPLSQAEWSQRTVYISHSSLHTFLKLCYHPVDARGTT